MGDKLGGPAPNHTGTIPSDRSTSFAFSPELRIRSARDFAQMKRHGRRGYGKHLLTIIRLRDTKREPALNRLGLTVTTKVEPRATRRNLLKRRIRDVFRHIQGQLTAPVDLLVIARQGSSALSFEALKDDFVACLIRERLVPVGTTLERSRGLPLCGKGCQ